MSVTIEERVINIICESLEANREKITPETSFIHDLNADSLDTVQLVLDLEEEFHIEIPEEDSGQIQTVGGAIEYIKKRLQEQQ